MRFYMKTRKRFKASIEVFALVFCISVHGLRAQTFTPLSITALPVGGTVKHVDVDNDNYLDLTLANGSIKIFGIKGIYAMNDLNANLTGAISGGRDAFAWGDYNNDGKLDIFLTGQTGVSQLSALYMNIDGAQYQDANAPQVSASAQTACWADFDNDGDLDLFCTGNGIAVFLRNNGNGGFAYVYTDIVPVYFSSVSCADYDKDGDVDILLSGFASAGGARVTIYRNDGNFVFHDANAGFVGAFYGAVRWGDYDADGNLDIIVAGDGANARVFHNNGSGGFDQLQPSLIMARQSDAEWGDLDNDGLLDLVIIGDDETGLARFTVYHNTGAGSFANLNVSFCAGDNVGVGLADVDHDGDLDIFPSACSYVYRNDVSRKNTVPSAPSGLGHSTLQHTDTGTTVGLFWNRATDAETPQAGLTYNIRVGFSPGGIEVQSPLADLATGFRRVVEMGNASQDSSWHIARFRRGRYYWSVQAIDNCFAGSQFAAESFFDVQNHSPVITSHPDTATRATYFYAYQVTAKDFDADSVRYSINTDAPFLSIDSVTGLISGISGGYQTGEFSVTVIARDAYQGATSQSFRLTVAPGSPQEFLVYQNFPNPFNAGTVIRYQVFINNVISLRIYDLSGRLVRSLVDGPETPGFKSIVWDGKNGSGKSVASGMYFCTYSFITPKHPGSGSYEKRTQVRKLILIR